MNLNDLEDQLNNDPDLTDSEKKEIYSDALSKLEEFPGKIWELDTTDSPIIVNTEDDQDRIIIEGPNAEVNARLVAAAPELLEALIALANIAEDEDRFPTFTEKARQAINKAKL